MRVPQSRNSVEVMMSKSDVQHSMHATELMVEHPNEPPSVQGNSVDVCRQSCIKGEGDPEVFKLFNVMQDSVIAKQA